MDAQHIPALLDAVAEMAHRMRGLDTGAVFSRFTCQELDSVATVLAVAGHKDAAAFIVAEHGERDAEEGDSHGHLRELHDSLTRSDLDELDEAARAEVIKATRVQIDKMAHAYVQGLVAMAL